MESKLLRAFGVVVALAIPVSAGSLAGVGTAGATTGSWSAKLTAGTFTLTCVGDGTTTSTMSCTASGFPSESILFYPVNKTTVSKLTLTHPVITISGTCTITFTVSISLVATKSRTTVETLTGTRTKIKVKIKKKLITTTETACLSVAHRVTGTTASIALTIPT
jgi:hypothetical protein